MQYSLNDDTLDLVTLSPMWNVMDTEPNLSHPTVPSNSPLFENHNAEITWSDLIDYFKQDDWSSYSMTEQTVQDSFHTTEQIPTEQIPTHPVTTDSFTTQSSTTLITSPSQPQPEQASPTTTTTTTTTTARDSLTLQQPATHTFTPEQVTTSVQAKRGDHTSGYVGEWLKPQFSGYWLRSRKSPPVCAVPGCGLTKRYKKNM